MFMNIKSRVLAPKRVARQRRAKDIKSPNSWFARLDLRVRARQKIK